jgi:hypothetical protein
MDISKENNAFIEGFFRLRDPENNCSTLVRNVCDSLPVDTDTQLRESQVPHV